MTTRRLPVEVGSVASLNYEGDSYGFNVTGWVGVSVIDDLGGHRYVSIDDFDLRQVGTLDVDDVTMSNARIEPEHYYHGTFSTPADFTIPGGDRGALVTLKVSTSDGSGAVQRQGTFVSADGTFDQVTDTFVLRMGFVDTDGNGLTVSIVGHPSHGTTPPAAQITGPGAGPFECTSPSGRVLEFSAASSGAPTGSRFEWGIVETSHTRPVAESKEASFAVPISYNWTPTEVALSVYAPEGTVSGASEQVTVVDTTPPTVLGSPSISAPCEWLSSPQADRCLTVTPPAASDVCDPSPRMRLTYLVLRKCGTGTLVSMQQAPACLAPPDGYDRSAMANLVWTLYYVIEDEAWNGVYDAISFQVVPASPDATCSDRYEVVAPAPECSPPS